MNKRHIKQLKYFTNNFYNFNNIQNKSSLGHNSLKLQKSWHSHLSKCYFGHRNKTIIFNFKFTLNYLVKALYVLLTIIKSKGDILIVNNNPELSKLIYHIKKNTHSVHLFFSDCGWTKGTLTNSTQVLNKVNTFINFYHDFDTFLNENNIHFPNYKKMKKNYKGFITQENNIHKIDKTYNFNRESISSNKLKLQLVSPRESEFNQNLNLLNTGIPQKTKFNLKWKPDLIILFNTKNTESIIKEACSLNIPIIGVLDSNANISSITYPIPMNTYSYSFLWFLSTVITKFINKYSR